jgi:hypothetical protein
VDVISPTDKSSHPQLWHPLFGRWVPTACPWKAWQGSPSGYKPSCQQQKFQQYLEPITPYELVHCNKITLFKLLGSALVIDIPRLHLEQRFVVFQQHRSALSLKNNCYKLPYTIAASHYKFLTLTKNLIYAVCLCSIGYFIYRHWLKVRSNYMLTVTQKYVIYTLYIYLLKFIKMKKLTCLQIQIPFV